MSLDRIPGPLVLRRMLESTPRDVDGFCREVRQLVISGGHSDDVFPVELLLRESLNNARIHGNGCSQAKRIEARVRVGKKWILISVRDEGAGFDCRKAGSRTPDVEATCGRGLVIYFLYAQRVFFNAKGNHVCLWRSVGR